MSEKILIEQNKVIIALLARSTIGVDYINNVVRGNKKKGNPDDFVKAYNALDGTKNVRDVAKMVGVGASAMGELLKGWEEKGIIYRVGFGKEVAYCGLLKLPQKSEQNKVSKTRKRTKMSGKSAVSGDIIETLSNPENSDFGRENYGTDQSEPSPSVEIEVELVREANLSPDSAES